MSFLAARKQSSTADVYSVTTARRSQHDDMHDRMVKYSISMGIRMVCIVIAFLTHGWVAWIFVAGAVILPYIAVVAANAGREQAPPPPASFADAGQRTALGAGPAPTPGPRGFPGEQAFPGEQGPAGSRGTTPGAPPTAGPRPSPAPAPARSGGPRTTGSGSASSWSFASDRDAGPRTRS